MIRRLNSFREIKFMPFEIFSRKSKILNKLIEENLTKLFKEITPNGNNALVHSQEVLKWLPSACPVKGQYKLINVEKVILKKVLNLMDINNEIKDKLYARAFFIAGQVNGFITGDNILDIGCGDGMVSFYLNNIYPNVKIDLCDVKDYRDEQCKKYKFSHIDQNKADMLPFDSNTYDTTLLITVLHHADYPKNLLREAVRITKKRIILIESVYGVFEPKNGNLFNEKGDNILRTQQLTNYLKLTVEEQKLYQTFFDWFYNRVLHEDVNVPYNFTTPDTWNNLFGNQGMKLTNFYHLGFDQPLVPEFHTLHVFDKEVPPKR